MSAWVYQKDSERNGISVGLVGDGHTDNSARLSEILSENRLVPKRIVLGAGTFLVDAPVVAHVAADLDLVLSPGCRIVGTGGRGDPVMSLYGTEAMPSVSISGMGFIDNGDRIYADSAQSGTALAMVNIDFDIRQIGLGRKGRHWSEGFGDSGLTTVHCTGGLDRVRIYGQPDIGIYISGSATPEDDDLAPISVTRTRMIDCHVAVSSKRLARHLIFNGNQVHRCRVGFSAFEARSGDRMLPAGQAGVVTSNVFSQIESRVFDLHGTDNWILSNNLVEDVGTTHAGLAVPARVFWLRGASNTLMTGNTIGFRKWAAHQRIIGFDSGQYTVDGKVHTPAGNRAVNNTLDGVYHVVNENNQSGVNEYDNTVRGAVIGATGMNAGSVYVER